MALNLTTPYDTLRYEFHALKKTSSNYLSSDLVAALASLHMNDFPHVELELFLSVGVCINLRK